MAARRDVPPVRFSPLLAALALAPSAGAQDLFERAHTPGAPALRRLHGRARHLEFVADLPPRLLALFNAAPTRSERDALRLDALRAADRALALAPDDVSLLSTAASLRERLGDYPRALRDADLALALAPEGPDAQDLYFTRAIVRTRLGDHLGARDDYLAALRLPMAAHTRGAVLGNLADTWLALGDAALAAETFARCVREAPDYSLGWLGLAIAQDRLGDDPSEAAEEALRTALTRGSGRADALLDELSRDGVFFVPAYDRHTYEAMSHEAIARAYLRGELPGGDADARRHEAAARAAWEAWSARAPADDRWRPAAARHLARGVVRPPTTGALMRPAR